MSQLKCPVCNHEYTEGTVESCTKCGWNLTPYPASLSPIPLEIQEREEQRLVWAKGIYERLSQLNKQNLVLKQQLEVSKKDHQTSSNNSLIQQIQQCLQGISSNIEYLPEMVNLLKQINQNLAYQSENFYNFSQSQQILHEENYTSVTSIESENQVDEKNKHEINRPSNWENSTINDDLVQNYNQEASFPDKIEVSETASSKEKRWAGSQEAPILELNHRGRGEYWIIDNQYLVPKPKLKINEHNYKTLAALFQCYNYENNATDNMSLIKPAKVRFIHGEEKWQLEEMGSLQF